MRFLCKNIEPFYSKREKNMSSAKKLSQAQKFNWLNILAGLSVMTVIGLGVYEHPMLGIPLTLFFLGVALVQARAEKRRKQT